MFGLLSFWGHALAGLLFGALTVWQARRWHEGGPQRSLTLTFLTIALWGVFTAWIGARAPLTMLAETARNLCVLGFMYEVWRSAEKPQHAGSALRAVYFMVGVVIGLQLVVAATMPLVGAGRMALLLHIADGLAMIVAAGSLILVHNLYGQAAPGSRSGLRLPAIALAGLWIYDLHLYTVAYFSENGVGDLFALRAVLAVLLVPLFAMASDLRGDWRMQLSRAATFQSISAIGVLAYVVLMMSATQAFALLDREWVRIGETGFIFALTLVALVVVPSAKARAWMRVSLTKHLFEHRYDYRREWLGFSRTVAHSGDEGLPLAERIVKGLADLAGSPSGLLLSIDPNYRPALEARWNWQSFPFAGEPQDAAFLRFIEANAYIVDIPASRGGIRRSGDGIVHLPAWLADNAQAWAGIPLLHGDRLLGLVVLAHPPIRRPLDWEDFDLFRTAGMQAASYLAEGRSQRALADSARFDEFNRRFAFIMHDIKNLVSQLNLVARNAERHADNPDFRADMVATLKDSAAKMNALLGRLDRGGPADRPDLQDVALKPLLTKLRDAKARLHPIELRVEPDLAVRADLAQLEQAVSHLLQNAIEASADSMPVRLHALAEGDTVHIRIEDSGSGMSAEFLRSRLFQPFQSTKDGGFGVGAFEARCLVQAMGGSIGVDSSEGEGTRFDIALPAAGAGPVQARLSA